MSEEFAASAERNLWPINIPVQQHVPTPAQVSFVGIKRITKLPREPVYNMEVDKYHNYSVCDGLIVHNCIDAVRYAAYPIWRRKGE